MIWPDGREIRGFTTATPEQMAGFSGNELLFIIDEASGFPDDIFEAVEGNLAGGGKIAAFGNPTKTTGFFFEGFRSQSRQWHRLHISSRESPNVISNAEVIPGLATTEWCDHMLAKYKSKKHPSYMVRVDGDFPEHSSDALIGLASVGKAKARYADYEPQGLARTIGIDPARFGDDETIVQPVADDIYAYDARALVGADGPTVAVATFAIIRELGWQDDTVTVRVDGIGIGAGVLDSLMLLSDESGLSLLVVDVNVSERADEPDYPNLRSQLWFAIGEWLDESGAIPDDKELEQELLAPRKFVDARGRLVAESKDEIRKKIKRSPNRADALALAIYRGRDASERAIEVCGPEPVFAVHGGVFRVPGGVFRGR